MICQTVHFPVRMVLDPLPACQGAAPLPAGFSMRRYRPGDSADWVRIHQLADELQEVSQWHFEQSFGLTDRLLAERQYYLCAPGGSPIGTATAWFNPCFEGQRYGRVHWIALAPEYQAMGLGKALLMTVLRRLHQLRHDRVYLSTDTARIPAIRLYLSAGFRPRLRDASDQRAWRAFSDCTGQPLPELDIPLTPSRLSFSS